MHSRDLLFLYCRRSPYYALGNVELGERKYENSLKEIFLFFISETVWRFTFIVRVFLTGLIYVNLARAFLKHVLILTEVLY
jgi:hypothetical protein